MRRIALKAGHQGASDEILEGKDVLRPLKAGERIFSQAERDRSYFSSQLPASFPPPNSDTFFFPARNAQHFSNNREDFMTLSFSRKTRVYVLLSTLSREPGWLRPLFFKLRDPYGVQVQVPVRWKLSGMWKTLYFAVGKLSEYRHQQLRVFKSKKVYSPGDQLILGGMGLGVITDVMPVVAFHEEHGDEHVGESTDLSEKSSAKDDVGSLASALLTSSFVPKFPASFYNGSLLDFESWLKQLVKSVRRNRHAEVRFLLESDLLRPPESSHLAQFDISRNLLPPEEGLPNYDLLVDLPARTRNIEMLTLLVSRGLCQMDYAGLRAVIYHFEDIHHVYGGPRGFLLGYMLRHPNPLSICSAIQTAIRAEIRERSGKRSTSSLEDTLECFTRLNGKIMRTIELNMKGVTGDISERLPRISAVLDPREPLNPEHPRSLSDMSPMRIAFADQDAEFMSAPMVESFSQMAWMGEELLLERGQEDNHTLSFLNPDFLYVVCFNLGLVCPATTSMNFTSKLWHTCVLTNQSFFNSPRGRWAMRLLSSITFIVVYLQVVVALLPCWWTVASLDNDADYYLANSANSDPTDPSFYDVDGKLTRRARSTVFNCTLFALFMAGNVLEAVQQVIYRYGGNILAFVSTKRLQFFILCVDMFMLFLTVTYVLTISRKAHPVEPFEMLKLTMCWTALAPIVWGRILITFIPLIKKLGPMLTTFQAMLGEILIFAVPWCIITAGFSVSLQVIFTPLRIPEFRSWLDIAFLLFKSFADKFEWALFDAIDELGLPDDVAKTYRIYGTVVMILYTILSTILLGNLLIAIITNRYKPEMAKAQFLLNFSETVDTHLWMVRHHLLSSPFNLIPMFFFWLPSAARRKVHPNVFFQYGLFGLDGFTPATPSHTYLASGRHEIPHLLYLLTIHPLMMGFTAFCFFVQSPYCCYIFASYGHEKLVKQFNDIRHASFRSSNGGTMARGLTASQLLTPNAKGPNIQARRRLSTQSTGSPPSLSPLIIEGELNQRTIDEEMAALGGLASGSSSDQSTQNTSSSRPLMILLASVQKAVMRIVSFVLFFLMGGIFYNLAIGGLLVLIMPLSIWIASIGWSLYHINAGALHSFLWGVVGIYRFIFSPNKSSKVSPDSPCAAPLIIEAEEKKNLFAERKLQGDALLTREEIERAILGSFSEGCCEEMRRGLLGDEVARGWAREANNRSKSGNGGPVSEVSLGGSEALSPSSSKTPLSSANNGPSHHLSSTDQMSRLSRTSYKSPPPV